MPTIQSTCWVFTLNFVGDCPDLTPFWTELVQYATWQHERVSHDHLQGFIQFKDRHTTLQTVKKIFMDFRPHIEKMRGNLDECIAYCQKMESRVSGPWEYGSVVRSGSHKRKRLDSCRESPERMKIEDPDLFNRWLMMEKVKKFRDEYDGPVLNREWQMQLNDLLQLEPDDRTIIWVYGPTGGEGKTTYSKQLEKEGWFVCSGGRHQDLMYLYVDHGAESHVCIDFSRAVDVEHFYPLIEDFKNRRIKSTKYKPIKFTELGNIHVVVMSNCMPDYCKVSVDRIKIVDCT